MTRIAPQHAPQASPSERSLQVSPYPEDLNGGGFASVLQQLANIAAPGPLSPAETTDRDSALRAAVAEVFNAYGFFAAGGIAKMSAVGHARAPEPVAVLPPVSSAERTAHVDVNRSIAPMAEQATIDAAPGHSSFSGGPASRGASPSRPDPHPLRPSPTALADAKGSALPASRTAVPETSTDEPASARLNSRRSVARASLADRLVFRIGEESVELTGRMLGVRPEEERELIRRLGALLAEHGLDLGSATLNGNPVVRGAFRSMHRWR